MPLPTVKKRADVLYYVTVFDFPHSTVRYQVPEGRTMIEKITTYEKWIEIEAERIAVRTGMTFGSVPNNQGQIALAALRNRPVSS